MTTTTTTTGSVSVSRSDKNDLSNNIIGNATFHGTDIMLLIAAERRFCFCFFRFYITSPICEPPQNAQRHLAGDDRFKVVRDRGRGNKLRR